MKPRKELERAVLLNDVALTERIINDGCDLDAKDKMGRTVLHDAVVKGYDTIIKLLCTKKANVNAQDSNGKAPLHFAAIHSKLEIAKILIQFGAVVDLPDSNGNTPLFDAIFNSKGIPDLIILLMENGADGNIKNNYDVSPKILAETISNFDVNYLFK